MSSISSYLFYLRHLRISSLSNLSNLSNLPRSFIFNRISHPLFQLNPSKRLIIDLRFNSKFNFSIIRNKCFVKRESKNMKSLHSLWSWDIISGLLIWLGIIVDDSDDPLILTIKRGLICLQNEDYEKAELILHSALQMSQDLNLESAQTYILDVLANNYFQKKDYKRAEKLFAFVFNRVLKKGMDINDESIIEISIKLSHIYSDFGDFEKCETGFDFCLNTQYKRVETFIDKTCDDLNDEEVNSLALLGMCYDYYAQHLSSVGHFDKSIDYYRKAIDICIKINGKTHSQTLVLLNDLSATYVHKNDYENALKCLKEAIDVAVRTEDKNLANFYYNIGSLYLLKLNKELALKSCKECLTLTKKTENKSLEEKARQCITQSLTL